MEDDQTDPEMVLLVLMERAFKGPTHEGVRILDWAPQLKRVLKCVRENDPMTMELRGEIERLRAELARLARNDLNGMCEAFYRVIEAYHSKANPFQNPIARDAATALRELRGMCRTITALAAKGE